MLFSACFNCVFVNSVLYCFVQTTRIELPRFGTSTKNILNPSSSQIEYMRNRTNDLKELASLIFSPKQTLCGECNGENLVDEKVQICIFGPLSCVFTHAVDKRCSGCRAWLPCTGDEEAIHRYSTQTAITYELHREYIGEVKHNRMPSIHAFWKRKCYQYLSPIPFMSLTTIHDVLFSMHRAVEIDWRSSLTCDLGCGDFLNAPILVGDGTALICLPSSQEASTSCTESKVTLIVA